MVDLSGGWSEARAAISHKVKSIRGECAIPGSLDGAMFISEDGLEQAMLEWKGRLFHLLSF